MRRIALKPLIAAVIVGLPILYLAYAGLAQHRGISTDQALEDPQEAGIKAGTYALKDTLPSGVTQSAGTARGPEYGRAYGEENVIEKGLPDTADTASYSENSVSSGLAMPGFKEKIIRSASLELRVKKGKFDQSFERALSIARSFNGYVSQSKSTATDNSIAGGEIIMRIPASDFEAALTSFKRLGTIKGLNISSEDVSEEYVDLESRLKHWRAQEVVMLDLMGKSKSISESITIQNSLSQIQIEIERISGRLKFLGDRVSYATISLYMMEPQAVAQVDKLGLHIAFRDALKASVSIIGSLIILIGYLLPLTFIAGLGFGAYRLVVAARKSS